MRLRTLALVTAAGSLAIATTAMAGGRGGGGGIGGGLGGGMGAGIGGQGGHGLGGGIGGSGGGFGPPLSGPGGVFDDTDHSRAAAHASGTAKTHANQHSVLGDTAAGAETEDDVDAAADTTNRGRDRRDAARANRKGPSQASDQGVTHSNANAGLRGTTTSTTTVVGDTTAAGAATSNSARVNRMGPSRASPTGVAHSNDHAGLRTGATVASDLAALQSGMTVKSATGTTLGEVTRVERSADGTVRSVLVRTSDGAHRVLHLAPGSLSISGGVVVTDQTKLGGNG